MKLQITTSVTLTQIFFFTPITELVALTVIFETLINRLHNFNLSRIFSSHILHLLQFQTLISIVEALIHRI